MSLKPDSTNYQKTVSDRFNNDRAQLREVFGELGSLSKMEGPLSDLHEDFSAVYVLHFATGRKLVYKPRRLRIDAVYSELCSMLFKIPPPLIVEREAYGWMQYFEAEAHKPLTDFLIGQQLALLTIMRSSDHHSDNLILSAGYPRFVDMECALAPEMTYARRKTTVFSPTATRIFQDPKFTYNQNELKRGFLFGIERIRENAESLIKTMESLVQEPLRVLLRGTTFYTDLIRHAQEYNLSNGEIYDVLIAEAAQFPQVAKFEAQCLFEGRIPRFTYKPHSQIVEAEGQSFAGLIDQPGLPLTLESLSDISLDRLSCVTF